MTLIIEPGTPEGNAKLEAIHWAEDQFNIILKQLFNRYRLLNGLTIKFDIPQNVADQAPIKVNVLELEPHTKQELDQAIEAVKKDFVERGLLEASVKKPMAEIREEGKKDGINQK